MAKMRSSINFRLIIKVIGLLLLIEGGFMLTAVPFSLYYGESIWPLVIPAIFTAFIGLILYLFTWKSRQLNIGKHEGYIIVTFSWVVISLFGAIPFILSNSIGNYSDAFFETISGFTTTGASILKDIESLPKGILFWRSLTHWIGGMGIIVLSLAILPILGIGGMQLFVAEVPGPTPDKIHPRITQTAKRLWGIYVMLTGIQTILLMFGGMNLFNALCHAFGTMATGAFSTQNTSIAGYSPYIQYVVILFMILAGTNFTIHYHALHRQFKKVRGNEEYRNYLFLLIGISLLVGGGLFFLSELPFEESIRTSLFQVVSIVTTTGYVTTNYLAWPMVLWVIIFLLMFTGGCTGSTGGGIKMVRQMLLFKNSTTELKRLVHPMAIIPIRLNRKVIPQNIIFNVLAFFVLYMLTFAFGTLFMSILGLDFQTAIGSVAATLGNIGPGIGGVGPVENYAAIPFVGKWFLSFLMLLGRLELFTVLILLSPAFWRR
ncbi:MAG: TrkH family potassium uptake protein [Bacteroidales bacterium]|nr:TrkH family potassium uptake protein [Bacteroidales bacterium]